MADMIDHMTSRFLQWKLPDDFAPDGGVTFTAVGPHGPVGTNLLTYTQAKAMVEYMIDGAPLAALEPASGGVEATVSDAGAEDPGATTPQPGEVLASSAPAPAPVDAQTRVLTAEPVRVCPECDIADCAAHRDTPAPVATDRVEALVKAAGDLKEIVEGIKGAMEHGAWRDENRNMRLKDTPEWVVFYNALALIGEKP